jgi:transcriptional regulator with XRE-family HTH domain
MTERSEIGDFLRSRRERLSPVDVGLPAGRGRRTPGLRREEVATLAGVSIDYLVRLEQGRDTNPSAAVMAALGDALRLSADEKHHLAKLVARINHGPLCPETGELVTDVRPTVRALLDNLGSVPAFVVAPAGDVLAWNHVWAALAAPLGLLDDRLPNVARHVFSHPLARTVWTDWDAVADDQAAQLRSALTLWGEQPQLRAVLDDLARSPEFVRRWESHNVDATPRGVLRAAHPSAGDLQFAYETLDLRDDGQRIVTWLPDDETTAGMLHELVDGPAPVSPARLRVVEHA